MTQRAAEILAWIAVNRSRVLLWIVQGYCCESFKGTAVNRSRVLLWIVQGYCCELFKGTAVNCSRVLLWNGLSFPSSFRINSCELPKKVLICLAIKIFIKHKHVNHTPRQAKYINKLSLAIYFPIILLYYNFRNHSWIHSFLHISSTIF